MSGDLYIITLDEAKRELEIPDGQDDQMLTDWLKGLQGRIDDHCQRKLLRAENVVEYFDGGERWLYLDRWPVESVANIYTDADQDWTADTLLESDDYRLHITRGRICYGTSGTVKWPAGIQNIKVTYTGGYVACDDEVASGQYAMPAAVRGAMFMQAGFEWRNRDMLGKQSVSSQGVSVNLAPAKFLPIVRESLLPYRRII